MLYLGLGVAAVAAGSWALYRHAYPAAKFAVGQSVAAAQTVAATGAVITGPATRIGTIVSMRRVGSSLSGGAPYIWHYTVTGNPIVNATGNNPAANTAEFFEFQLSKV